MTDDIGPGQTALQRATLNQAAGISDSRDALLGYSCIMIVAAGVAARLGGAEVLRASGAFHEVSVLPNGSLWLRATPTINEFTGNKVRRVFEVLAPELPDGVAEFRFSDCFRIVEGVDAADYRRPGASVVWQVDGRVRLPVSDCESPRFTVRSGTQRARRPAVGDGRRKASDPYAVAVARPITPVYRDPLAAVHAAHAVRRVTAGRGQ